jgi:signal transduction histidine kinase
MRPILRTAADQPAFRAYLRKPNKGTSTAALAALHQVGPNPQQTTSAELWDTTGHQLLAVRLKSPGSGGTLERDEWSDSGAIGRFHNVRDTLLYPSVVAVRDGNDKLGYLVQWRAVTGSPQTQRQYSRLIGANAGLYLGNDRGDLWTDLSKRIAGPPADVHDTTGLVEYERPGRGPRMAYVRPLSGVPWIVLLEFSRNDVLSTAQEFLGHLAWLTVIILVVGLLAAWLLSRGISGPLEELTTATESVASGGYTTPVPPTHYTELARLGDAFNTMARQVRESQHRLEERVAERTRELQARNEELEAFGYSISHDLRAPLRAMQGFSQILLEDYADRLDAQGKRYAGRIVAGATRMDLLIRDLLTYSRISREHFEPSRVSLSRVVKEAIEQLDAELQESGAKVKVEEPLPMVVGHPATLSQVVANLLGNGIKFVPPGRVPAVKVRAEGHDGVTRLWVEDNGIGIQQEHQERIFRVFERLHATEDYPGTGIGLAIVRKGVERMGGRTGVESAPGEGSRFWIELPTVEGAA